MIKKIRSKVKAEHKTVISNAFALFILQGLQYLLPLILLPYLVRVLGIENFGLLAFASATIAFLRGVVAYGFDLSGPQQIAMNREHNSKITEIFSSIMAVKYLLVIFTFIILCVLLLTVDKFGQNWELFLLTFLVVLGDAIFPTWYFQGMEKMKFITYLRIGYKFLFVLLVIMFVKKPSDLVLVPLLDGVGAILVGIIAMYIVHTQFRIAFIIPKFENIIDQFNQGWYLFLSKMTVHFYTSINILVLGLMTSDLVVGYYSISMKIYGAIRGLLAPVNQALLPYLSKKYVQSKESYYLFVKKLNISYCFTLVILSILTYTFSQELIQLISGHVMLESITVLQILSISIVFALGGFYSILLVVKSEGKVLAKITTKSMVLNVVLLYPSIYFFGIIGLAFQFVIVQIFQATLQLKYNKEIFYKGIL